MGVFTAAYASMGCHLADRLQGIGAIRIGHAFYTAAGSDIADRCRTAAMAAIGAGDTGPGCQIAVRSESAAMGFIVALNTGPGIHVAVRCLTAAMVMLKAADTDAAIGVTMGRLTAAMIIFQAADAGAAIGVAIRRVSTAMLIQGAGNTLSRREIAVQWTALLLGGTFLADIVNAFRCIGLLAVRLLQAGDTAASSVAERLRAGAIASVHPALDADTSATGRFVGIGDAMAVCQAFHADSAICRVAMLWRAVLLGAAGGAGIIDTGGFGILALTMAQAFHTATAITFAMEGQAMGRGTAFLAGLLDAARFCAIEAMGMLGAFHTAMLRLITHPWTALQVVGTGNTDIMDA